jgi:hypothetical protein
LGSITPLAVLKTLWTRAPWWRFVVLSSLLLVLLMVLFPPRMNDGRGALPVLDAASYQAPPMVSAAVPVAATPTPAPPAGFATAVVRAAPSRPRDPPAVPPASQTVRTASLGLVRPDRSDDGSSGIDPALLGSTYHDKILMSGFELPLPPGEWAMLARSSVHLTKYPQNAGMQYFLGRIEHARLTGAIGVTALRSPDRSGFEEPGTCASQENIYTRKDEVTPFAHQACWTVHLIFISDMQQWADKAAKMGSIYRMAGGDLSAKGVTYPQEMIGVHFFRSEAWGLLEAVYHFSPETEHIRSNTVPTSHDSDWFGENLQKYPDKLAYTEKLKQWGETHWPSFESAFDAGAPANAANNRVAAEATHAPVALSGGATSDPLPTVLRVRYLSPRNGREIDVTDQFKSRCPNMGADCRARCGNEFAGVDPDFGQQKICAIDYQCPSRPAQELRIREGSLATLSCASPTNVTESGAATAADARRCAMLKFGEWRRAQDVPPSAEAMNSKLDEVNAQCGASLQFSIAPSANPP